MDPGALPACMYMHCVYAWFPRRPDKVAGFSETELRMAVSQLSGAGC